MRTKIICMSITHSLLFTLTVVYSNRQPIKKHLFLPGYGPIAIADWSIYWSKKKMWDRRARRSHFFFFFRPLPPYTLVEAIHVIASTVNMYTCGRLSRGGLALVPPLPGCARGENAPQGAGSYLKEAPLNTSSRPLNSPISTMLDVVSQLATKNNFFRG
jgi:hypothetical protein